MNMTFHINRFLNDHQNIDIFATLESYTPNNAVEDNFFISYCQKMDLKEKEFGNYDKALGKVGYEGIQFDRYKLFTHATGEFIHVESQTSWYNTQKKKSSPLQKLTPSLKPTLRYIPVKFELGKEIISFGPSRYDSNKVEMLDVRQYFLLAKQFFHFISKDQNYKDKISSKFKLDKSITT